MYIVGKYETNKHNIFNLHYYSLHEKIIDLEYKKKDLKPKS